MGNVRLYLVTLKPQYNDPISTKIAAINNLISSPFVVNSIVKRTSNKKTPAIKYKIFCPFRLIELRFQKAFEAFKKPKSPEISKISIKMSNVRLYLVLTTKV
jgi:hypothetical protein